jgi:hypothetical protein
MRYILLVAVLCLTLPSAFALDSRVINALINVCEDHNGKKVDFVFHQDIQSYAYASIHNDARQRGEYVPIIHVNTRFFKWISPESQAFVLAHECGHHALGHVAKPGGSNPRDEFQADCYAVRLLFKLGIIDSDDDLVEIEKDFFEMNGGRPAPRSRTHPGTIERFDSANACYLRYAR